MNVNYIYKMPSQQHVDEELQIIHLRVEGRGGGRCQAWKSFQRTVFDIVSSICGDGLV